MRTLIRKVEHDVFRGVRPHGGFQELAEDNPQYWDFFTLMQSYFEPLNKLQTNKHALKSYVMAHILTLENLSATNDKSGSERLWVNDDGEALASLLTQLQMQNDIAPPMTFESYVTLFETLLNGEAVTARYGKHPRLSILGQIEARMVQADRVILAGLNEGIWPPEAGFDVWMSRKMRSDFGLPSVEQKTTLAAHDFFAAFCAHDVVITRSKKSDGQPTLPSRWLNRLNTVMQAAGLEDKDKPQTKGQVLLNYAHEFMKVEDVQSITRPQPMPALERRPLSFSVTEVEKWMRDPYWIYAKKILNLQKLDPVDMEVGAADRGTLIHETIEKFVKSYANNLPDNAYHKLIETGRSIFDKQAQNTEIHGLWWPRFTKAAQWFIAHETGWRKETKNIYSEMKGKISLPIKGSKYLLKAKADRIESRGNDSIAIIDYKTGSIPSVGDVALGLSSQLPIEAFMVQEGAFEGIKVNATDEIKILYWSISGTGEGGLCRAAEGSKKNADAAPLIKQAGEGVQALFTAFHNGSTAYIAQPDPKKALSYNDYAHLERITEWSVNEGDDDGSFE
jgi:ATP-dependent helicase/nuclease subunit B